MKGPGGAPGRVANALDEKGGGAKCIARGLLIPKRRSRVVLVIALSLGFFLPSEGPRAWHDETHLAVAKSAGYSKWYNATGADMAKIKAGGVEQNNHYCNESLNVPITPSVVMSQIAKYDSAEDTMGHLYGAIVSALRNCRIAVETGKYPQYHLSFAIHYLSDLSQPLHNMPFDDFNMARHGVNDGIVEYEVLDNLNLLESYMYSISLDAEHFEESLASEIARIANISLSLGSTLKRERRNLTRQEAYAK